MKIPVVSRILEANERLAQENRALFRQRKVFVLNVMSSPGAGKTSLLEATIRALRGRVRVGVLEGDIQGSRDAERIGALGVPVVQLNTGGACHLDASMVRQGVEGLPLEELDLLFIENVGNLVCPAEFDVGEHMKCMLLSITEGEDKPLKYPLMFQASEVLLLNKMDLRPHLDVDVERLREDVLSLNPSIRIFEVSATKGQGIAEWAEWLLGRLKAHS
jgi:hydrogenase nickel incorporation protein HypB